MKIISKNIIKYFILFIAFSSLYVEIEILFRNRSDRSMIVLSGICGILIGLINYFFSWNMSLILQGIIGGLFIVTPLEYVFGILFNSDYHIWDYRTVPFNINGQVCLPFSIIWCFIAVVCIMLDDYLRYFIFGEEKPHYRL